MSKRLEAQQIMADICYQLWPYPTTMSACPCGKNVSRGGRRCSECLVEDLVELTGRGREVCFWRNAQQLRLQWERDILDAAEKVEADA